MNIMILLLIRLLKHTIPYTIPLWLFELWIPAGSVQPN